jgi:hypothetical protein
MVAPCHRRPRVARAPVTMAPSGAKVPRCMWPSTRWGNEQERAQVGELARQGQEATGQNVQVAYVEPPARSDLHPLPLHPPFLTRSATPRLFQIHKIAHFAKVASFPPDRFLPQCHARSRMRNGISCFGSPGLIPGSFGVFARRFPWNTWNIRRRMPTLPVVGQTTLHASPQSRFSPNCPATDSPGSFAILAKLPPTGSAGSIRQPRQPSGTRKTNEVGPKGERGGARQIPFPSLLPINLRPRSACLAPLRLCVSPKTPFRQFRQIRQIAPLPRLQHRSAVSVHHLHHFPNPFEFATSSEEAPAPPKFEMRHQRRLAQISGASFAILVNRDQRNWPEGRRASAEARVKLPRHRFSEALSPNWLPPIVTRQPTAFTRARRFSPNSNGLATGSARPLPHVSQAAPNHQSSIVNHHSPPPSPLATPLPPCIISA